MTVYISQNDSNELLKLFCSSTNENVFIFKFDSKYNIVLPLPKNKSMMKLFLASQELKGGNEGTC